MMLTDHLNSPIPQIREDREWGDGRAPEPGPGFGRERDNADGGRAEEPR